MMSGTASMYRDSILQPSSEDRYAGSRILWFRVILRAMFDWVSYKDSQRLMQKKLAESAHNWFFCTSEMFNGFENVCLMLEIDPKKIQQRVLTMSKDEVEKIEFKERRILGIPDDEKQVVYEEEF